MKVILQQTVKKLGNKHDVVNVANGYARNYLIPQHLAVPASPGNLRAVELFKTREEKTITELASQAKELLQKIDKQKIKIKAKAGEKGSLYGSISAPQIATHLGRQLGLKIPTNLIDLASGLKTIGDHPVRVRLSPEIVATIIVSITPDTPQK
jgi:large subunit ribosomal protein L9